MGWRKLTLPDGDLASVDADAETLKHAHGKPVAVMLLDPISARRRRSRVGDADVYGGRGTRSGARTNPSKSCDVGQERGRACLRLR